MYGLEGIVENSTRRWRRWSHARVTPGLALRPRRLSNPFMTRLATLMLALILGCSRHAFALEPHVHGTGRLQLVIEDGTLYADLRIPADDVVGYEHAPTTVAERATLTHALALLQDPTKG